MSALGLQRVLGLNRYETTWTLLHKLRIAMVRPGRDCLKGPVQIDETYIRGYCSGKRGRGAAGKTLVLIAGEDNGKHLGRIRLHKIKDASAHSLVPAIKESVQTNSEINTDAWNGYNKLPASGYTHRSIRKTSDIGENLLSLTNRVAALLKRWVLGIHQGAPLANHLDYYLGEFVFRVKRRTSLLPGLVFYCLIQQAVNIAPVMGKDIYVGRH